MLLYQHSRLIVQALIVEFSIESSVLSFSFLDIMEDLVKSGPGFLFKAMLSFKPQI